MSLASLTLRVTDWLDRLGEAVLQWDELALNWVSTNPWLRRLDGLWVLATYLGDGYIWGLLGLYLILFGTPADQANVLVGLGVTMVEITVFRLFKAFFSRPRPPFLAQGLRQSYLDTHSFPSGHATIGFGMAYLIAYFYPHWSSVLLAYVIAGAIGLSRVYLREHFPMDVIGGAALGTAISWVLTPLFWLLIH
ncbi:TPA: phosphatase PAP2 family protein [Candidatus Bipolaricaulota bacterium]|nr:phosphatase PAP2 family protein [Candidatus Bipolaricaulota bacterium]